MTSSTSKKKTCFITIGSTTGFQSLIDASLSEAFLAALKSHSYTHLVIQHGVDGQSRFQTALKSTSHEGLEIAGFGVDPEGLDPYLLLAAGRDKDSVEGAVISHAGSGTILAAMRLVVPLVVVPNEKLLDNHQVELADALAGQGYVVRGDVATLPQALDEVEVLREKLHGWPPVNHGGVGKADHSGGIQGVMDAELGFLD